MSVHSEIKKVTTKVLADMKARGEKISMLTAYDYSMASVIDQAGMDIILVGDSASNVMAGNATTLPITLDQIIYHAQCVVRGAKRAFVVVDMPFGTTEVGKEEAVKSAVRIMKESGADAVKIEGGEELIDSIRAIIAGGIPVMGHLGLMPQSINQYGSFALRANDDAEAQAHQRRPIAREGGMLLPRPREDPCGACQEGGLTAPYTSHRYRRRQRSGRTSARHARYVRHQQRLLA